MPINDKVFHLAITMAGAISAGAYTAGVLDFILESLDNWADMKQDANEFFDKYPELKGKAWEQFTGTPKYEELKKNGKNLADLEQRARRYNSVPDYDIQIDIISGASAGGMTAAIASLVLQLENKHHVKFLPDVIDAETLRDLESIKENNRLYNSWINLTDDDMLSVLLSDTDIKYIGKPVAVLNSQFIRQVAERALKIDETDSIGLSPYIAEDFNLFVTLTNLEGYQKSLIIDQSGQREEGNYGEFITYDHSDLVTFSFGENDQLGTVHIDFRDEQNAENKANIKLLSNAAVATGAFPIGLEYASFSRQPVFINKNKLIKFVHSDTEMLVDDKSEYLSTFIDGGLINNEPFELTDCLLKDKLKNKLRIGSNPKLQTELEKYLVKFNQRLDEDFENLSTEKRAELVEKETEKFYDTEVKRQKNYTILMIDPFPSEKKTPIKRERDERGNYYPFSLIGAIGQLISVMRTQLLVKSNLFSSARDVNDFSCYLIAPRRRSYEKNAAGKVVFDDNGRPKPLYEKDEKGNYLLDKDGRAIPKIYDGSAAIACGSLGGFGGFLDKRFREHDFYLGRLNCQSFLQKHFRIKSDGENSISNIVTEAYSPEMKKIFQKECKEEYVPIIPDMTLLKNETRLSTENATASVYDLYVKLEFPKYNMQVFRTSKDKLLNRLWMIIESLMKTNEMSWTAKKAVNVVFWYKKEGWFNKIVEIVEEQLKKWELTD